MMKWPGLEEERGEAEERERREEEEEEEGRRGEEKRERRIREDKSRIGEENERRREGWLHIYLSVFYLVKTRMRQSKNEIKDEVGNIQIRKCGK